jgi:predicted phosphodiesterase
MKVAVISDIHGNIVALKKVLEDIKAEGIRKFILLGDVVVWP